MVNASFLLKFEIREVFWVFQFDQVNKFQDLSPEFRSLISLHLGTWEVEGWS
jgi:hypothetical protein